MSQDDLWMNLLVAGLAGYVFWLWLGDYRLARAGTPSPQAFPGAVPAKAAAVWLGVGGALALLAIETGGEIALGVADEQSDIQVVFLLGMVAAAFYEELVFRGFLVVTHRGRALLAAGVVGCSLLFALLHPFLWAMEDWRVTFDFSLKAWWSTGVVFAFSLWLYFVRFSPVNPARSLVPCFAAHLAKNLGVFAIKLAQGHVTGWW